MLTGQLVDDVSMCVKLNPFLYLCCLGIYRCMNVAVGRIWRDGFSSWSVALMSVTTYII